MGNVHSLSLKGWEGLIVLQLGHWYPVLYDHHQLFSTESNCSLTAFSDKTSRGTSSPSRCPSSAPSSSSSQSPSFSAQPPNSPESLQLQSSPGTPHALSGVAAPRSPGTIPLALLKGLAGAVRRDAVMRHRRRPPRPPRASLFRGVQ